MKGIIIDVRENSGGNSYTAAKILRYFTSKDTLVGFMSKTKEYRASFKASRVKKIPEDIDQYSEGGQKFYREAFNIYQNNHWYDLGTYTVKNNISDQKINVPIVVLMGNHTISAAEDFIVMADMTLEDEVVLVGNKTFGSTGQPLFFRFPQGGVARIVSKYVAYPDGKEFVGIGIEPDIYVKKTINDLINNNDPELNKAIEILRKN